MAETLFFVHSDAEAAQQIAGEYHIKGWHAESCEPGVADAIDRVASARPTAVVFCLDGDRATEVCGFAESVLSDERVIRPFMVFVGGRPADVERARATTPLGVFVNRDELQWVLKRLEVRQ